MRVSKVMRTLCRGENTSDEFLMTLCNPSGHRTTHTTLSCWSDHTKELTIQPWSVYEHCPSIAVEIRPTVDQMLLAMACLYHSGDPSGLRSLNVVHDINIDPT